MEDSAILKISQTLKAKRTVKTIISFKNENEENMIAVGLIGEADTEQTDFNNLNNSNLNSNNYNNETQNQVIFFNITTNKEWGFNFYPKKTTIDHLVFYLEHNSRFLIALRCSNEQNLLIFDYKSGEILRKITVPRAICLLFKSFKYRGIRRFAYDVNKQDLNLIDFETSGIITTISFKDFTPAEAKKMRFISNRLILILLGKKSNGLFVIRFLDIESRQIILEHGFQNSPNEVLYNITPLRHITKFSKVILNYDNDDISCGMFCLKYNIDGSIVNEKYANDLLKNKKQLFLMKWSDNNHELIDLVENSVSVLDFNTWKCKYNFDLGINNPVKLEKIKINNIYFLAVLYDDGSVCLLTQKN